MLAGRLPFVVAAVVVVVVGIGSRLFTTGSVLIDKYLGDALYAGMIYLGLGILRPQSTPWRRALLAMALVAGIEWFQTTGIPSRLSQSPSRSLRLLSIALGTQFAWRDMLAYAAGLTTALALETHRGRVRNPGSGDTVPPPAPPDGSSGNDAAP